MKRSLSHTPDGCPLEGECKWYMEIWEPDTNYFEWKCLFPDDCPHLDNDEDDE